MLYADVQHLRPSQFKRLTGVLPETFQTMLTTLQDSPAWREFGRPPKLCRADQLLMTLMYWREYRTQFHIAQSFGVSEPTVCRTIKRVEDVLAQSGAFTLPGKKALTASDSDTVIEVVLVDASESPIERPKKDSASSTVVRRSATP